MYSDEVDILLEGFPDIETQRQNWRAQGIEDAMIVGFIADKPKKVKPWGPFLADQVIGGFLALSYSASLAKNCLQTNESKCSIGLELAHAFPRTVAGELSGVVTKKTPKTSKDESCWLLSVNHVVWMNGWALPGTGIVCKPFGNPRFTTIGTVDPSQNHPLKASFGEEKKHCHHVNTTQELAFARPAPPRSGEQSQPYEFARCPNEHGSINKDPETLSTDDTVYRLDCCCKMRTASVVCTDFRLAQRFEYGRFLFKKQILLKDTNDQKEYDRCHKLQNIPFATRGNSGALLYKQCDEGYVPAAVLWAGTPDQPEGLANKSYYLAIPLAEYFKSRGLEFVYYRVPPKGSKP